MKRKNILLAMMTLLIATLFSTFTYAEWKSDDNGYRYLDTSKGQYVVNNWIQDGNGYYFLDLNGYMVKGWYLINGKYYYFNQNGLMQTGFLTQGDKIYYLDTTTGQMVTGWIQTFDDGVVDYYFFDENGIMANGWRKIGDKWYYFYDGKCLVDIFAEVNNMWYHFGADGGMTTGWVVANNKMYYFDMTSGALMKGWIRDQNGYDYYLSDADGSLTLNTSLEMGGVNYTFDSLGRCISKNVISNYVNNLNANVASVATSGVNIGVSPGMLMSGNLTSIQNEFIEKQGLEAGSTTGPK